MKRLLNIWFVCLLLVISSDLMLRAQPGGRIIRLPLGFEVNCTPDPGGDRLYGWDDSENEANVFTLGTGLSVSGTTLSTDDSAIVHDNLSGVHQGVDTGDSPTFSGASVGTGKLITDEVRAYDSAGLKLYEDGGKGIFVQDSTGNVGIGTTSPGARFEVKSSGTSSDVISAKASDGSDLFKLYEAGTGQAQFFIMDASGNAKVKLAGGTTASYFNGGGNVVIGGTSTGAGAVKVLTLADGTAPGALANTSSLVSLSGELYGYDSSANGSQLTSHPPDAPPTLCPHGVGYDWVCKRIHTYQHFVTWQGLDGTLLVEQFADYNKRMKFKEGDDGYLVARDWDTDRRENAIERYMVEEIEVAVDEATEEVEIVEEVETTDLIQDGYEYVKQNGKIKVKKKYVPKKIKQGTGKFKLQSKEGVIFDRDTGRFQRHPTRDEAAAMVKPSDIEPMPQWMENPPVLSP